MSLWILRTVQYEDVVKEDAVNDECKYLLLVCEEYDTYNYRYSYIPASSHSISELIAMSVCNNRDAWLDDWYASLSNNDNVAIFGTNDIYNYGSIRSQVEEKIEELEQGE